MPKTMTELRDEQLKYKLQMQYFGEDAEAPEADEVPEAEDAEKEQDANEADSAEKESKTYTEKDVQSMVDRRVNQALDAQRAEQEKRTQQAIENALAEQKRKAGMTKEQLEQEAAEKAKQALADKETELNRRELLADTTELVQKAGLPKSFANIVMGDDIDAVQENIETVNEHISELIEVRVNEALRNPDLKERKQDEVEDDFIKGFKSAAKF